MERGNPLRGQVSPVLGGGGVWGEEDVLDHTCVPLFHCSLPRRLVLRVDRMGDPGQTPAQRDIWPHPALALRTLVPLPHCPGTGLGSGPAVPTQLRGQGPWDGDKPWWEVR